MKPKTIATRDIDIFFKYWSPNMAYILGYFASDGSMYKNKNGSCYIAFCSADKELIDSVKYITQVPNKIELYQPKRLNSKLRYTLQICSKNSFNQLMKLGFHPNKSLSLNYPNDLPDELVNHFLRGYFDGDGSAYYRSSKRKDQNGDVKYLILNLRSGSRNFLQILQKKLKELINVSGSLYWHSRAYSLAYSGRDVVKLYSFLYPTTSVPHLGRKRTRLETGIKNLGS